MHSGGAGVGAFPHVIPHMDVIGGLHCKVYKDQGVSNVSRLRFCYQPSATTVSTTISPT